jgi:hypothetical protein
MGELDFPEFSKVVIVTSSLSGNLSFHCIRYHRSLELNVQSRVTLDPFIPTLEGIVCTISTNEIDKINKWSSKMLVFVLSNGV